MVYRLLTEIAKIQKRALRIINFEDFRAASNPLFKRNAILGERYCKNEKL